MQMRKFTNVTEAIEYEVQDWLKCGENGTMYKEDAAKTAEEAKAALERMCSEHNVVEVRFFDEDWEDGENRGIAITEFGEVLLFGYDGNCGHIRLHYHTVTDVDEREYLLKFGNAW